MKGIAHFVTGVAVATFFPQIVHGASQAQSFGPLLGGLAGLLPDTLDFRFVRFFERSEIEIDPARMTTPAGHPDAQAMAERIAAAIDRAHHHGKPVRVRLHTLKLGPDRWRRYCVSFGPEPNGVTVQIGPVVTTAQAAYAGSEISGLAPGEAHAAVRILNTYGDETTVDIFDGPSLAFAPAAHAPDVVEVTFLPWHRAWSHSVVLALSLGIAGWLAAPVYGLVMALAALAHVAEDQMGFLGSNLFWPLSSRRIAGLKLFHSGDPVPNLLAVWTGLALILLNLDRFSGAPTIPVWPYLLGTLAAPYLALFGLGAWQTRRERRVPAATSLQGDSREVDT